MRTALRTSVGWVWFAGPLALLAFHIWHSVTSEFVRLSYYTVVWGSLLALAACGFWFLINGPGAKWLLRAAAIVVALFTALNFLISWDHGGARGIHEPFLYGIFGAIELFCILTIGVAGMQPNSTPHSDAREAPSIAGTGEARAGGRERYAS